MGAKRKCTEQDIAEELILDIDNNTHSSEVMDMSLLEYTTPNGLTVCNVDLLYRFTLAGYDKTKHSILPKTLPYSTFSHFFFPEIMHPVVEEIYSTSTHWMKHKPYCLI